MLALAFKKTLFSLQRGFALRMIVYSILITLLIFAVIIGGLALIISPPQMFANAWAWVAGDTLDQASAWFSAGGSFMQWAMIAFTVLLVVLLFPLMVPVTGGFLSDSAILPIEKEYGRTADPSRTVLDEIWAGFGFMLPALGWNLLCLPFYFIPGVNVVVWLLLNASLMAKQFYIMIAPRHLSRIEEKAEWKRHRWQYILAGAFVLMMSIVPFVNLVAPIIGIVFMTHLFLLLVPAKQVVLPPIEQ